MLAPRVILIAVLVHLASATSEGDNDAVVVEAAGLFDSFGEGQKVSDWRRARANSVADWSSSLLPPGPCFSNQGRLGRCTTFRQCYPYFKLPDLSNWETWVLGVYDTCSYFNDNGRQMFGVCCTLPSASAPVASAPIPVAPAAPAPPTTSSPTTAAPSVSQPYPNNPIPPNWPPPIPTHPPDHTIPPLPTHPPSIGVYPPKPPTTQAPATTSKRPVYPVPPNWPPTIPTHPPPVTKPPIPTLPTRPPTLPTRPPTLPTRPPTTPAPRPPVPAWPPKPVQPPKPVYPPTKPPTLPTPPATQAPPSYDGACGYQDQERIVGGQNADIGEWPWIAALFNGGRQFCGGSLIDDNHILTAAHCVAHMSSWDVARLTVRLGDHNIKTGSETKHIEKRVRRVVRHRGFDARTLYNDIALLTLDSPVSFRREIRPICLPSGSGAYTGLQATVIGWGSLRESGPQPAVLQEVTIPVWSNSECRLKYGAAAPGGIVESFLCAGQASRDSCSGDSGGPLMVNDGKWTQVGVVSWGIGCGKGQYPGVYTRVTSFMPWIRKNLSK